MILTTKMGVSSFFLHCSCRFARYLIMGPTHIQIGKHRYIPSHPCTARAFLSCMHIRAVLIRDMYLPPTFHFTFRLETSTSLRVSMYLPVVPSFSSQSRCLIPLWRFVLVSCSIFFLSFLWHRYLIAQRTARRTSWSTSSHAKGAMWILSTASRKRRPSTSR